MSAGHAEAAGNVNIFAQPCYQFDSRRSGRGIQQGTGYLARTSRIRVISEGAHKRLGGPQ